jgi:hypothetical protein
MKPELARIVPTPAADALQAACSEARLTRGHPWSAQDMDRLQKALQQAFRIPAKYLGYPARGTFPSKGEGHRG